MSAPSTILPETLELPPLVVDLDRSLIRVDLLHEALARLGLRSPLHPMRPVRPVIGARRGWVRPCSCSSSRVEAADPVSHPGRDPRGWTVSAAYFGLAGYALAFLTPSGQPISLWWSLPVAARGDGRPATF